MALVRVFACKLPTHTGHSVLIESTICGSSTLFADFINPAEQRRGPTFHAGLLFAAIMTNQDVDAGNPFNRASPPSAPKNHNPNPTAIHLRLNKQ